MSQIFQIAALAIATLGTGAATMTVMNEDIPDMPVPAGDWADTGALDGRTFSVIGLDHTNGERLEDELVFRNGTFQSKGCEEYCAFGWTDYTTKTVDGVIHFSATPVCPDAPHTVVWYGSVSGDELTVEGTWTTRRWYWTHQIAFSASGARSARPDANTVAG